METEAETTDPARHALRAALFDYCKTPGKYQVTHRQPSVLFAALSEILQIAVGREGEASGESASLRDAARFFIRTGLLYPGSDHYALMGLERKVENAELKDRYRLMMRLLHPDFAGPGAGAWPTDAAVRVNRAYDVLSSPVQRREYDERLPQIITTGAVPPAQRKAAALPKAAQVETRETRFKQLAAGFAIAAGLLIVVALFATGTSDTAQLVQRMPTAVAPLRAVLQEVSRSSSDSLTLSTALSAAPMAPRVFVPPPSAQPRQVGRAAAVTAPPAAIARGARFEDIRPTVLQLAAPSREAEVPVDAPPPAPMVPQQSAIAVPPAPAPTLIEARLESPAPLLIPVATVRPAPRPAPTLTEAQPLLTQLLQLMEGGRGDRILNLLDVDARSKPSALALSRQYDSLVEGARPVRLSHVEFKAHQADGRLLVIGQFRLIAGEQTIGSLGKRMVLRAEFASREGNVVITGLSSGADN